MKNEEIIEITTSDLRQQLQSLDDHTILTITLNEGAKEDAKT